MANKFRANPQGGGKFAKGKIVIHLSLASRNRRKFFSGILVLQVGWFVAFQFDKSPGSTRDNV